jgi:hypothetical protein
MEPKSEGCLMSIFLSLPVCRWLSFQRGEGEEGWAGSRIMRPRESLVLYKSFNTPILWMTQGEKEWHLSQLLYKLQIYTVKKR